MTARFYYIIPRGRITHYYAAGGRLRLKFEKKLHRHREEVRWACDLRAAASRPGDITGTFPW